MSEAAQDLDALRRAHVGDIARELGRRVAEFADMAEAYKQRACETSNLVELGELVNLASACAHEAGDYWAAVLRLSRDQSLVANVDALARATRLHASMVTARWDAVYSAVGRGAGA